MATSHILGFPRIGKHREMKKALESYWRAEISLTELMSIGYQIQKSNWALQAEAGLDFISVDFSWYDHVLDMSAMLGVIPERFKSANQPIDLNTLFCMARGQAPSYAETNPSEMTKWFNTNYHYLVPEFSPNQVFRYSTDYLLAAIEEALPLGKAIKPVLLGPLTFLWLGKTQGNQFDKLELLDNLLPVYDEILASLKQKGITWVQMDEPILGLDLPKAWQVAFEKAYNQLNFNSIHCLLTTYFCGLDDNLALANKLPVQGVHVDFSKDFDHLLKIARELSRDKVLSAGVIDGRNIWKADLNKLSMLLEEAQTLRGKNLSVASSCSLLHVPVSLEEEKQLPAHMKNWLAFAKEKVEEVAVLSTILNKGKGAFSELLKKNKEALKTRQTSTDIHHAPVKERLSHVNKSFLQRDSSYEKRALLQKETLNLPLLPTTTIGSFPQTQEIRVLRQNYKSGKIDSLTYQSKIEEEIAKVIQKQEKLGLDVLVHGEPERNDMVEYFAEFLKGFLFTQNGWVQSYGSRCVKPPIIYGDVFRPEAMTVKWSQYAQSLSSRPVKGMLTGPVTILAWSFVRDDQPQATTALQIALALRDEVKDLANAGIKIIQIDEPAFREALPLRKKEWSDYLAWAVSCFRAATSGIPDQVQIHTRMCYSEFNDVIDSIASLDADVITIESSRSQMELLKAFESFSYPNEIGPGVYDIHSPRVPSVEEIENQLESALECIPISRLWVNPDCGLKTRNWSEVELALENMVKATRSCRQKHQERAL